MITEASLNQIVLLSGYNNYYNRIVKREEDLPSYINTGTVVAQDDNINFNPGDGLTTQVVYNYEIPNVDYLLVSDGGNQIYSRWFVINQTRTLRGQYILSLRRDVVADHLTSILSSECFIEKGILPDTDPGIFNSEDMTFSQIKQNQVLLQDDSECAWIVGYYARTTSEAVTELSDTYDPQQVADITLATPITDWEEYKFVAEPFYSYPTNITYRAQVNRTVADKRFANLTDNVATETATIYLDDATASTRSAYNYGKAFTDLQQALSVEFNSQRVQARSQSNTILEFNTKSRTTEFLNYDNKILLDSKGNYYRINITRTRQDVVKSIGAGSLYNTLDKVMKDAGATRSVVNVLWDITYRLDVLGISFTHLANLSTSSYAITSNRVHAVDAPYDVFAIPYSDNFLFAGAAGVQFVTQKQVGLACAMRIAQKYGGDSGLLYDIQLLPYCPFHERLTAAQQYHTFDERLYSLIKEDDKPVGVIFHLDKTQFRTVINPNLDKYLGARINNVKVDSQTKFCRFCSPNYNGVFEISQAKTDGLTPITITCTYKPYVPFIQVVPHFGRLYGNNFTDARGLICGGDFSLPVVTSQWSAYEIQHKNYAAIFDRQIENMEVNNNVAREREAWQIAAGTLSGAVSGLSSAAMASGGNPLASVAGTVGAGALSLAGGLRDRALNEMLRNEAIDYSRDQFGYSLGNIRALPNSLNKVSAFNINNQIFPFIEFYDCPIEETLALANKIKYNGMTVGRIGRIGDFIRQWEYKNSNHPTLTVTVEKAYIKAKIIRLEQLNDDFTIANAIASELYKGVYIDGNTRGD